jgi:hypothetical protein
VLLSYIAEFGQTEAVIMTDDPETKLDREFRQSLHTRVLRRPETAWVYERLGSAIDGCNREFFGFDLRGSFAKLGSFPFDRSRSTILGSSPSNARTMTLA